MKSLFLILSLLALQSPVNASKKLESRIYGEIPQFTLTDANGKKFSLSDLKGSFWVADFIFTRCQGPCPLLTRNMKLLSSELPQGTRIVTFTVDPDYDTPPVLTQYAKEYSAEKENWHFLTGEKKNVYELIRNGFKIGVEEDPAGKTISEQFIHSTYFVLGDPAGKIRGYFDGNDAKTLRQIPLAIKTTKIQDSKPWVLKLPKLNALLNGTCGVLLLIGFQLIRKKMVPWHRACMVTAFFVSSLFLVSYLTYHYYLGSVPFLQEGGIRSLYFILLISHTILAILVLPLALLTLNYAAKGNFVKHKKLARWTFPLWLYVSLTGVAVYTMLYHL